MDADAAFARLDELVSLLPVIQEKDARLMRAREARRLLKADKLARILEKELKDYQNTYNAALRDAKKAADADDHEGEARNLSIVRAYSELISLRLAPEQRAKSDLRKLLEAIALHLDDPLEDYALSDEDFTALEQEILAYQEDYRQVYALCLSLEDE
ncbi:MAG: hypothetical protein LBS98_02320 [Coriobacteriales bacterium]|jgi:hypothetical protein|nr:hypothetical protein [Coriobacteriales bacterium]